MTKTTIVSRVLSIAVLLALLLAAFPTTGVAAYTTNKNLEDKWDQLVDNYTWQSLSHNSVHKHVDHWLATNKDAKASEKAKLDRHLVICNSALASAGAIVSKHPGFDSKGNVIDRGQAKQSIKQLANYLGQHARSVAHLEKHLTQ